jgi:predicted SnoaL-like aldol condensation-catalyzing enzyme
MNKKRIGILGMAISLLVLFLSGCATGKTEVEISNTKKALSVVNSFATGDPSAIETYVSESYIQHNLAFPDGRQTLLDVLPALAQSGTTVENVRSFEDGDIVVLHSKYNLFNAGEQVGFDVFRFEDGKIVEHWDNLLALQPLNPSGRTQLDGPVAITDLDKTEVNKALVADFVQEVLIGGNFAAMPSYFDGNAYIQHNPGIGDTLEGLGSAIQHLSSLGISMEFDTIHYIYGSGNFVLVISEGTFGTADDPVATSYYDLFRVENGKIAEHWDVMEPITTEPNAMNPNHKF